MLYTFMEVLGGSQYPKYPKELDWVWLTYKNYKEQCISWTASIFGNFYA